MIHRCMIVLSLTSHSVLGGGYGSFPILFLFFVSVPSYLLWPLAFGFGGAALRRTPTASCSAPFPLPSGYSSLPLVAVCCSLCLRMSCCGSSLFSVVYFPSVVLRPCARRHRTLSGQRREEADCQFSHRPARRWYTYLLAFLFCPLRFRRFRLKFRQIQLKFSGLMAPMQVTRWARSFG